MNSMTYLGAGIPGSPSTSNHGTSEKGGLTTRFLLHSRSDASAPKLRQIETVGVISFAA
jgi:hypothetical protein